MIMGVVATIALSFPAYTQGTKKDNQDTQKKEQVARKGSLMHYSITIHGKVQNVGFRKATKEKAKELGIKGEARNEPDGTVFIEAEGTPEQLQKFVAWCKEGPAKADVENVEVKKTSEIKNYTEFDIDRMSQKDRKDSTGEERSDKKSDHKGNPGEK